MHVPVVWQELLDDLDCYDADEAAAVLGRIVAATDPDCARDHDLVAHVLLVARHVLDCRRPGPSVVEGELVELELARRNGRPM